MAKDARAWCGWQVAACIAVMASPVAADASGATAPGRVLQVGMEPLHERLVGTAQRARVQVAEAYRRSPVMVMGLGLAGAVPVVAGLFAIGRTLRRRAARREKGTPGPETARIGDKAWIDVGEGADAVSVAFTGEILRIGRHSDNDIALAHEAIHRHHALIQRTPDEEFVLLDLTAGTGNQPLVNGRPVARAALRDGDCIALGDARLIFHLGVEAPAALARPETRKPTKSSAREMTDDERDAGDEPAGRAADGIETRRIATADRIAARGTHRSGA